MQTQNRKLAIDNHTATVETLFIHQTESGGPTPYLELTVGCSPAQPSLHTFSHIMPNPSTPPKSQDASTGSILSETTPLKRDLPGSQTHTSTPQPKASLRYKEMTREACEKFVGPMPVDMFLSEFVPRATMQRPTDSIPFSISSVSQNEDAFVRHSTSGACLHSLIG